MRRANRRGGNRRVTCPPRHVTYASQDILRLNEAVARPAPPRRPLEVCRPRVVSARPGPLLAGMPGCAASEQDRPPSPRRESLCACVGLSHYPSQAASVPESGGAGGRWTMRGRRAAGSRPRCRIRARTQARTHKHTHSHGAGRRSFWPPPSARPARRRHTARAPEAGTGDWRPGEATRTRNPDTRLGCPTGLATRTHDSDTRGTRDSDMRHGHTAQSYLSDWRRRLVMEMRR